MSQGISGMEWIEFYMEFADRLLEYKGRRTELVSVIKDAYAQIGLKLPKLDEGELSDIDPLTVFGLFNKGVSDANRTKIASALGARLHVGTSAPLAFDGIPVLNNLSATFYLFGKKREPNDIDNLWRLFEESLTYAGNPAPEARASFCVAYDRVIARPRIKWNLSMALYWVRPFSYINLDSRNRWFITDRDGLDEACASGVRDMGDNAPDGTAYLEFCDAAKRALKSGGFEYMNFPGLSRTAWTVSERVNEEKRAAEKSAPGHVTLGDNGVTQTRYWLISPGRGAVAWDEFQKEGIVGIGWSELGDPSAYESKEDIRRALKETYGGNGSKRNDALALWDFMHTIKPGDVIYAKKGQSVVLGRGIVKGDCRFDAAGGAFPNRRRVEWTNVGEWEHPGKAVTKTLTDITAYTGYVAKLEGLFADEEGDQPEAPESDAPSYGKSDFLSEVYLTDESYEKLVALLREKKNVILQGAPGVGKTFMAKRLAYAMMGARDAERVKLVQFHQSYSYEDFIMGYRPSAEGFELKTGAFYDFCKKAEDDPDNPYFFIIDEINRGNLSKIFGELFMLVEADKRGYSLRLLYSDEQFGVPENLYIIGMMNTADRSLAMLDYALRRRFAFFEVGPAFSSEGFRAYQKGLESERFDRLVQCVEQLNGAIENDDSLGRGFCIGHSYLCGLDAADLGRLHRVVEFELSPLLEEYWFDEPGKVRDWKSRLKAAIG